MSDVSIAGVRAPSWTAVGGSAATATLVGSLDRERPGHVLAVDPAFERLSGLAAADMSGWTFHDWLSLAEDSEQRAGHTLEILSLGQTVELEVDPGRLSPACPRLELTLAPLDLDRCGRPSHVVCTARAARQTADERRPGQDPLTGLLDRAELVERLERACKEASDEAPVGVMFVDVDHFKLINDALGHQTGDAVLVEVAARLRCCTRAGDAVARFGGDEFVIVLEGMSLELTAEVAGKVVRALALPVLADNREVPLSASVGFAVSGPEASRADQLLANADTALYEAKASGRGRERAFDREVQKRVTRRVELASDLRRALREEQFELAYQPQVDLLSGKLVGVEALLRWNHPRLGRVPPGEFVSLAEETGLILPVGRWVIHEACRQLGEWNRGPADGPGCITINISPVQLADPELVDDVRTALSENALEPSTVCLELTESALMHGTSQTVAMLAKLRELGVYLGVDDFGTGYSSLARLRDLPVEVIKIDRSFVDGLGEDPGDSAIVASIMSLAFAMGLHAVAEGVENPRQSGALSRLGCNTVQGFLYSRPVQAAEIPKLCAAPPWRADVPRQRRRSISNGISRVHGRRGRRRFIDEFLDQIGVHMHGVESGP